MSSATNDHSHRTGSLYGAIAYGTVILTCFAGFLGQQHYYSSEWMVPVVFALGGLYGAIGVLGGRFTSCLRPSRFVVYYLVQCTILTAIIYLSPSRGFMGILVLPVVSQAVFDLRARYAWLIGVYLFTINVALWGIPFGWRAAGEAVVNYAAAFAFTVAFTIITKRALLARTREEKLRQEVEQANAQLRAYAAQAEDLATTRERNRLAREIHDGVGHYLTVVKTQLDAAAALMPTRPEQALEAVTKAAKLTAEALDDVRRSVGTLRADTKRPPLAEALRGLAVEAGLPVTLRVEGPVRALPPSVEHALFRSAQEGLTNVRKHATATVAEVALDFTSPGRVALAVLDDGRGRDVRAEAATAGGFGLQGIHERIELLGGRVSASNRQTGGFALTVEVPA